MRYLLAIFFAVLLNGTAKAACQSFETKSDVNSGGSHQTTAANFLASDGNTIPKGWWKFTLYRGDPPSCPDTSELNILVDHTAVNNNATAKPSDCDYIAPYLSQWGNVYGFHKNAPIERGTPKTFCVYVSGDTNKIKAGAIGYGAAQCSTYYMTAVPPSCNAPVNGGADQSYDESWEDFTTWDENDQSYYTIIDDISNSPRWRFKLPEDAYYVDFNAGKFVDSWANTNYKRLNVYLGTNQLWWEDCIDGSTCPEWEIHNMRPDLYPSAKDAPVFSAVDKTVVAKRGNYYFKFEGTGKAGMRLVFKDINGKPIKFGKSPECGGATPTPSTRPTATPIPPAGTITPTPAPAASCIPLEEGYNASIRIINDVQFADGETKTFCYYMNSGTNQLEFALRERNTVTYCSRADITVYPPDGSTSVQPESRHWTNYATIVMFVNGDAAMPRGNYRIQVTNKETPGCDDQYTIWGRIPPR